MPSVEDVPNELKNYASPKTLAVGVADRRTGADTLVILSGTVVFPTSLARYAGDPKLQRTRFRFVLPQAPKVVTAAGQVRSMQVVTALASFHRDGDGDVTFAIDQAVLEWADDVKELRCVIDTAYQGRGATINRVMYNAFVLARTG